MATFPVGEQPHLAVPPQRQALEPAVADNPESRDETDRRRTTNRATVQPAGDMGERRPYATHLKAYGVTPRPPARRPKVRVVRPTPAFSYSTDADDPCSPLLQHGPANSSPQAVQLWRVRPLSSSA